jgi:hypothetical protein
VGSRNRTIWMGTVVMFGIADCKYKSTYTTSSGGNRGRSVWPGIVAEMLLHSC